MWAACCLPLPWVALAAPRGHAKSTAITLTYTLALVLFGFRDFGIIIADTETQASQFLQTITAELQENEDLIRDFGIAKFEKDSATDIRVLMKNGKRFCLMAKGSGQKIRGSMWRGKRPNFFICDDLENDEIVLNDLSRQTFKEWFFGAALPAGSRDCITRLVGTVLHQDSLLLNLLEDRTGAWHTLRYSAHKDFDDFADILWPERYDEKELRRIRDGLVAQGLDDTYAREYLNQPLSPKRRFFNSANFQDYDDSDYTARKVYYCAVDFAISKAQRADYTVFLVAGINAHGVVTVEHISRGRWDSDEIIEEWFRIDSMFAQASQPIEQYVCEQGAIQKSLAPFLNTKMEERGQYLNILTIVPSVDKETRARAISGQVKAKKVRFDMSADWWDEFKKELNAFPRGKHDDQVDAFAYIGLILDQVVVPDEDSDLYHDEWEAASRKEWNGGKNTSTGY